MSAILYNVDAPKKPTNLTINSDLLAKAKQCHINLSQTLERSLTEILRQREQENWQEQNKAAIEEQNRRVEHFGVFSDGIRQF